RADLPWRAYQARSAVFFNNIGKKQLALSRQQFHKQFSAGVRRGGSAVATILIVDDDIAVQATIRLLLERAGHSVVVASNARKALAAFDAGDFDLLLLDIFMPDMDGLETMRLVRQ